MTTLLIVGTVLVLIIIGIIVLRRQPATSTTGGVTLDIQGKRMTVPDWAWKQISKRLSDKELKAFEAVSYSNGRSYDPTYEIMVIGRIQAVAWNWMTKTREGRTWLQATHPDLIHLTLLDD